MTRWSLFLQTLSLLLHHFLGLYSLAVTSGEDFLGHFPVRKSGPVLFVDQDTPQQVLAERLGALRAASSTTKHALEIESQMGYALDSSEDVSALVHKVQVVEPVLLILETLDTLTSGNFNENRTQDMGRLFHNLSRIQNECSTSILISHHFVKKGQVGEPLTWIRGSSALPARVDIGYGLERLPHASGQFVVQPFPKRIKTAPALRVELKTTENDGRLESAILVRTGGWNDQLDFELNEKRSIVTELMHDRGTEGITVKEVVETSQGYLNDRQARDILDSLLSDELADRGKESHGRFRFWLTEHAPEGDRKVVIPS